MKPNSKLTWKVKYAPGTLSAKGFDVAGNVIAETKVETTGEPDVLRLTQEFPGASWTAGASEARPRFSDDGKAPSPLRSAGAGLNLKADGEDIAVFTVTAFDAQGRVVPVAQNKINFAIEGAGKIIGVGNGDPSCHEPDTFVSDVPVRTVALNRWRWQQAKGLGGNNSVPEYAPGFDDSGWSTLQGKGGGEASTINTDNTTAIYRAHLTLTADDLGGSGVQIHFNGCDDEGWYFVNGQYVGESHDWDAKPAFDITKFLHAGDNVIAVRCRNGGSLGGLNPNVKVDIALKPSPLPWSRSLFNGLAQVIVQSTCKAGEFKLTASAEGLAPTTAVVNTQPCTPRPSMP
jgi:beta-galactosidase